MSSFVNLIKTLIHKALHADIVKVFSFTSIATLVRMATGLVSVKVVAGIIGPAGVALVGQLNNFSTIVMQLACGGINSGVTKYVSENKEDEGRLRILLSTALRITIVCSVTVGLVMIAFNRQLSRLIMLDESYGYVFTVFGFTVLLYALNNMLISIVNGFKEFRKYVSINIANSIVGLCFTLAFAISFGLKGALLSAISYQSVMLFVTLFMVRKLPWMSREYFRERFSTPTAKKYLQYTLMALVSAACVPVVQLLLRGNVISQLSLEQAGWWEGMNRISNMYLMVITGDSADAAGGVHGDMVFKVLRDPPAVHAGVHADGEALRLADARGLLQDMQLAARLPDAGEGEDDALYHDGDSLLSALPDAGIPACQGQRSCRIESGVPDKLHRLHHSDGHSFQKGPAR